MKKMIYVPKKFKVTIGDNSRTLFSNKEYNIVMKDGSRYNGTIKDANETTLGLGIEFTEGYMLAMKEADREIMLEDVTEIFPIRTKYVKAKRSIKEMPKGAETFTFSFDIPGYSTPYKITILAEEFVALSVVGKNNGETVSLYGHIMDFTDQTIKFRRYISNKGERKIVDTDVAVANVLGVYRQTLEIDFTKKEEPVHGATDENGLSIGVDANPDLTCPDPACDCAGACETCDCEAK